MSAKKIKKRSRTDWKRIDAMRDEDIDFSDIPELGPDFFQNAVLWPGLKEHIALQIDADLLRFFRKEGHSSRNVINAVLRKYMEAQERRA